MSVSLEVADYSDLSWTAHEVRLVERVIEDLAEVLYTLNQNPHCDLTEAQIRQVRVAFHNRITKLDLMDALWFQEISGLYECGGPKWDAEQAGY